jgi:formylglycine-generating enzyme required for sulfatase activity
VRARAVGHRTAFKRIDLAPAGTSKATFRLERMQVEPGSVFTDPLQDGGQSPEMVVIPAGKFRMGNAQGPPSEQPVRQIILTQPFAVSRHEISIGDYLRFADATGARLHDRVDRDKRDHAMAYVTFEEGAKYAAWLSAQTREKYRLPSEAEWEYVARAGSDARYFFGDDAAQLCEYANIADLAARASFREWDVVACDDGFVRPGPVGSHRPNPFGVYDIYGNVSEWVLDCGMPSYEDAPADGSAATEGESCESHGFRGGSWDSRAPEVTSAYRNTASSANDDRGLRLVREL